MCMNGTSFNQNSLDQFLDYWDRVIADWFKGNLDKDQQKYGHLLNKEYMPEPYIGDPRNCSFVIVNYNAGAGDSREPHNYRPCADCNVDRKRLICYVKDNCYSKIALPFPFLMDDSDLKSQKWDWIMDYSGYKWWQQKKEWIENVTNAVKIPSMKEKVMPFAIELCAWHSKSWSNTYDIIKNPELKKVVEEHVINVIKDAIDCSYAEFAYFIGKKHIPLLDSYGFKWKYGDTLNTKKSKGKNRFFAIYKHPQSGHKALVTWTIGSNSHPGRNFFKDEANMINILKNI